MFLTLRLLSALIARYAAGKIVDAASKAYAQYAQESKIYEQHPMFHYYKLRELQMLSEELVSYGMICKSVMSPNLHAIVANKNLTDTINIIQQQPALFVQGININILTDDPEEAAQIRAEAGIKSLEDLLKDAQNEVEEG